MWSEVEPIGELRELKARVRVSYPVSVLDDRAFEQARIPCEQDAPLAARDVRQPGIVRVRRVKAVEPRETQVRGKAPEVSVEDEPQVVQGRRTDTRDSDDIDGSEARVSGYPIARLQPMRELDWDVVGEKQIDFGMRDADRFDGVLRRTAVAETAVEPAMAERDREEIVEAPVKPEGRRPHTVEV